MTTYRYDPVRGVIFDPRTGQVEPPLAGDNTPVTAPYIRSDIPPYASPVTGKMITSRPQRRDDLARAGCVECDPATRRKHLRNPHFAAKHNARDQLHPEVRETMDKELKKQLGY